MFARISRIVVLGLALTVLGGTGVASAGSLAGPQHAIHMAGDEHCC
jgi:hypothetical protein